MVRSEQLLELVQRWEQSGGGPLEDVCADSPELLGELTGCIGRIRSAVGSSAEAEETDLPNDPCTHVGPEALSPDEVIGGRYRILRRLGDGGMGSVFEAEDLRMPGRHVALKFPCLNKGDRQAALRDFQAEIKRLAGLSCPGVVKVMDSGVNDANGPYFVMEMVRGQALGQFVKSQKPSCERRLRLMVDVCRSIDRVHKAGVLHRDLKPDNIIVQGPDAAGNDVPVIVDFGVAADLESLQRPGELPRFLAGTTRWLSPDQLLLAPDELDCASDVYALGMVLYNLVTDARPYFVTATSYEDIRREVCESVITPPREHCPHLPADLEAVILKALERDRRRRYQTAAELADDLERFLDCEPVRAWMDRGPAGKAPSFGAKAAYVAKQACRRKPITAGVIAGLALLVVGLVVIVFLMAGRITRQEQEMKQLEELHRSFAVTGPSASVNRQQRVSGSMNVRSGSEFWRDAVNVYGQKQKSPLQTTDLAEAGTMSAASTERPVRQTRSGPDGKQLRTAYEIALIASTLKKLGLELDPARMSGDPAVRLAAAGMLVDLDQYDHAQRILRSLPASALGSWDARLVQCVLDARRGMNERDGDDAADAARERARRTLQQLLAEARAGSQPEQASLAQHNLAMLAR